MKSLLLATLVLSSGVLLYPQEREIPKDSVLITMQGCARGRTFIVGPRTEHSTGNSAIEPGRRFRLNGPKKILADIKARESSMVEVTGLVRKGQLGGPGGISVAGGRIRIGGALPRDNNPARTANYNEVVIDLEGYRMLAEACPAR